MASRCDTILLVTIGSSMLAIIFIGPPHALHTLTSISTRGAAELLARPIRPSGKRGRLAQSDTQQKVSGYFRRR
ncbi:hypothetical protein OAM69_04245 [bacterium]|nr:hypothetical protein [bacterium]